MSQAAEKNPIFKEDPALTAYEFPDGSTDAVRFWVSADMGVTVIAFLLSVIGIVLGL